MISHVPRSTPPAGPRRRHGPDHPGARRRRPRPPRRARAATGPAAPEPQVLDGNWSQDSQVTRLLCATTHLQGEYAEEVAGALLDPSFTALASSWGLDPVALAAHAKLACDRRKERDRSLRYCLSGMLLTPVLVLCLWVVQGLSPFNVALSIVAVVFGGWAVAWMIISGHYELIRVSALEAMDTRLSPRDTAPPLDEDTRERLERLRDGNVVIFGGYQPFVGCGVTLDSWTICIDLRTGRPDDDGTAAAPASFDAFDLHEHLRRTVPPQTPGGMWAANRLFVAGAAAKSVPGLVPDPRCVDTWPASDLPEEVLEKFTRNPSEVARTYVCLARPAWRGEIVVSMLVRAEQVGSKLFVEGRAHALLPPRARFREVKWVPRHPGRAWLAVARSSAAVVTPLLFGSLGRHWEGRRNGRAAKRGRERMRKDLVDGCPLNYGATSSLREDAADAAEVKYYTGVDEVISFRLLKRQVLAGLEDFLREHGIDCSEFRRQADTVANETTVYLHDVTAASQAFGPGKTVTVGR